MEGFVAMTHKGSTLSALCPEPRSVLCRGAVGSGSVFTRAVWLLWRMDLKLAYVKAVEVVPFRGRVAFTQGGSNGSGFQGGGVKIS